VAKQLSPVAVALRKARAAANLTQSELSERSGVARPTISNIEAGVHRTVRLETLEKLAEALDCPISALTGEMGGENAAIEAFMASSIAVELDLSREEVAWLRELRIKWRRGRRPSGLSFVYLIEALRHAR
jgi:transcriptional regulator with XRE-family HTH domain